MSLSSIREWLVRASEEGLPVTFKCAGAPATQGWVAEVYGDVVMFFENGPFGGDCEVPLGTIDPESLACRVDGRWVGWTDDRAR